jgi:hypothetical protein
VSDDFEGLGMSLAYNGASMAISVGVGLVYPGGFSLIALLPFFLGALGVYHYVRARSAQPGLDTAHHARLCTHFGLLAISIVGCVVTIYLVGLFLFFKD